jgi:hypothetical protein
MQDEEKCGHCDDGFIQIKTAGVPAVEEPCAVCRPDEAETAWRKTQKRIAKEPK